VPVVGDQVHITLAVFLLLVGHAVKIARQGPQALGQQAHAGGMDGKLASLGLEDLAFCRHDVAQVPVFEGGVQLFTDLVAREENLDTPGAVLQGRKTRLAHHALEHHAAGDLRGNRLGGQRLAILVAVGGVQLAGMVGRLEVVRKGHAFAVRLVSGARP
jgi:hypothetical protein